MTIDFTGTVEKPKPTSTRVLTALGVGALAVFGGALGWALLGYLAGRMSLAVAFIIGAGVALAFALPFTTMSVVKAILLFVPCVAMTLVSILLGEYLCTVLLVSREFEAPLLDSALAVALNPEVLSTGDTAIGLFFGVIGGIVGFANVVRRRRQGT